MFGIEKDFQNLMEQVYGPLNKDKMTDNQFIIEPEVIDDIYHQLNAKRPEERFQKIFEESLIKKSYLIGYQSCKDKMSNSPTNESKMNNQEILNALNEKIKAAEEALLYLKQTKEGLERVIVSTSHPPTLHDICKDWWDDDDENPPITVLVERIKNEWLLKSVEETCGLNEYDGAYYNGWNMYRENLIKKLV